MGGVVIAAQPAVVVLLNKSVAHKTKTALGRDGFGSGMRGIEVVPIEWGDM